MGIRPRPDEDWGHESRPPADVGLDLGDPQEPAPEALGPAALVLVMGQILGVGSFLYTLRFLSGQDIAGPRQEAELSGTVMVAGALLSLAASAAALARLRRATTGWAAGVSGAAMLLAVLLLAIGGWTLWSASDLPSSY